MSNEITLGNMGDPRVVTIDFETWGIEGNPLVTPPRPIGVSIKIDDAPSQYFVDDLWGVLDQVWHGDHALVFHNAPFDISVAVKWLGLPIPEWWRVHDTKLLVYLYDPHAKSMSLKPSAERILGTAPEERDELREWIIRNVKPATTKSWGAYIRHAPTELVGQYAEADTDLTYALYDYLATKVPEDAYTLERELQPYLTEATQTGIRVDRYALQRAEWEAYRSLTDAESRIQDMLCCHFDVHNGAQLADALDKAGKISKWTLTPTGKRSTSRENLEAGIDDQPLLQLLSYAGAMRTCLNTFIRGWLSLSAADGRLHPSWNQVRGDNDYGTRTGRMSCSGPNLQNVPKPFKLTVPSGLCPVPNMRSFLLPEPGCVWVSRDFSAQEIRLLAHFEQGALLDGFIKDPSLDPHQLVVERLKRLFDIDISRAQAKTISFGIVYGMGIPGMAVKMDINTCEAGEMIEAYHHAFPGVSEVQQGTKDRGRCDKLLADIRTLTTRQLRAEEYGRHKYVAVLQSQIDRATKRVPPCNYVETIGGRQYKVEPPIIKNNRMQTFEYKLMNYLIQGSAADQTKRALVSYFRNKPKKETFLCTVHDEINTSVPGNDSPTLEKSMEHDCNEGITVPMKTTLETGLTWGAIK